MTRRSVGMLIGGRVMDLLMATRNDVWAIVLMRGVPLRIAEDPTLEGSLESLPSLQTNAAAVDSELRAFCPSSGLPPGGFVRMPFSTGRGPVSSAPARNWPPNSSLVTRLDGPRPADVRRMIDDSLYAEENRLTGLAVIDTRGLTDVKNDYTIGDDWLRHSHQMLVKDGWQVSFDDKPEVLPASDPCNHVAIYPGLVS